MAASKKGVRRIAVVIGNSSYPGRQRLDKPVNDAAAIAEKLGGRKGLGFKVIGGTSPERNGLDVDLQGMTSLFDTLMAEIAAARSAGAVVHAIIYYAGHGIQIAGENYLIPIGAKLKGPEPLKQLFKLRDSLVAVADQVGSDGVVIAFFDACRDKSLDPNLIREIANDIREKDKLAGREPRVTAVSRGFTMPNLAPVRGAGAFEHGERPEQAPTYIAFATAPGEFAFDGDEDGPNSPFTQALCDHISVRGLEIKELYDRVQDDVRVRVRQMGAKVGLATQQVPWSESNLHQQYYFRPRTWRPILGLTLLGWLAGVLICLAMFNADLSMRLVSEHPALWATSLLFASVVGFGSCRWGSGELKHIAFAVVGTALAFALALGTLQNADVLETIRRVGSTNASDLYATVRPSWVDHALAIAAGLMVAGSRWLQLDRGASAWERVIVPLLSGAITMIALWVMQLFLSLHQRQDIIIFAMLSLFAGMTLGLGSVLACKPQLSVFRGFGAPTGGMAAGLTLPVLFTIIALKPSYPLLLGIAPLYFAILGFQLGWCFSYYVSVHRKLD